MTPNIPEAKGKGGTTATTPTGAANGRDLQAELNEALSAKKKAEEAYGNLRSAYGTMSQEIGVLRRQRAPVADEGRYDEDNEEPQPRRGGADPAMRRLMEEQGVLMFRTENPDWQKHWPAIQGILDDPLQVRKVAAYRDDAPGVVDFYVTFSNALDKVKLKGYQDAESAAANKQASEGARGVSLKNQAIITGGGMEVPESPIDLSDSSLSSEDIAKAFPELVQR